MKSVRSIMRDKESVRKNISSRRLPRKEKEGGSLFPTKEELIDTQLQKRFSGVGLEIARSMVSTTKKTSS